MKMDNIRPLLKVEQCWLNLSPEQIIHNMEEEKSFFAPSFVVISLPAYRQLKKRKIKRKTRNSVRKISEKEGANMSYLDYRKTGE